MLITLLEQIANTQRDTKETVAIEAKRSAVGVLVIYNSDIRTIIQRKLQWEPEIIRYTYMTYCTNIECWVLETINTQSTTYTKRPIPLTFIVPWNGGIERIDPIISSCCTNTIKHWNIYRQINHVCLTQ